MTFTQTDPQNHQSENTWFTPRFIIDAMGGPFDLDPCTVSYRPFDTARAHIEHDKGGDGLAVPWAGEVWLNPPYGKEIGPFIERFIAHRQGCMLIFARMGSRHVQDLVRAGATFYMLRKRVKFIDKQGKQDTNAGTDSMLVYFGLQYSTRAHKLDGVELRHTNLRTMK